MATKPSSPKKQRCRRLAFVLDIDGCLSKEGLPIAGSKEALHTLRSKNIPFVVCTNGGGQLESTRAAKLSKTFDIAISPEQVILSHTPLRSEVVPRLEDSRVLIVGEHCGEVARAYGIAKAEGIREYGRRHPSLFPRRREEDAVQVDDVDDPVKAILIFEDPEDLGESLQLCLDVLLTNGNPSGPRVLIEDKNANQEVEVWFTNPDLVYSGLARHPRLTQGSYRLCLETLYQSATSSTSTSYYSFKKDGGKQTMDKRRTLRATTVGKPTPLTGKTALSKLLAQCPSEITEQDLEIWTVGDNPSSDVALAHTMGWNSALVRTGIWNGDVSDLEREGVRPTRVEDSFAFLARALIPE
mmetsp:Transcript_54153/g.115063  ORF Transcript_54153/g.115063 Transcript_54153/m.115063 type:complete len:355 (-) Transcript_54153:39-1103(-)|eukprot:CAMPEP_0172564044 /NCGR_PEP_ID=MMETSP1067-20121228/102855_1 /TAXON_ID=265564 ORGANISM="Thalassiosira punctigera, Strain Tpunct2005C2" /NCGR_SAMPLE_ID=MMETSP1067 /ASSEMBLY_ACC=CAM_ASM_000444 /LENGTH=354 /DNA_ID=CAMNT_0013354621 /DNA_START=89 /DNA_END=1150 /DNA_ORIENTATION=+